MKAKLSKLIWIISIITVDQLSKHYIMSFLKSQTGMVYSVCSFLDLVYTWNYGISFGLMSHYYQYSNKFFLVVNTMIMAFLIYEYRKLKHKLDIIGFTLIIAGAIGNLVDRIFRDAVFDFIHFHYQAHYFAAFNIADAAITTGVGLILIKILFVRN